MRIFIALLSLMIITCCSAADQKAFDNVNLIIVGKYDKVISDMMSDECLNVSHEMHIRFKVIRTLLGHVDLNGIEVLKCYHYGDNPFEQGSLDNSKSRKWLLLLSNKNGKYREVYSTEIFKTNTGGGAICPINGEDIFYDYGLLLKPVDYKATISVDLKSTTKYKRWYYSQNKCFTVSGDTAKLTKGIYVRDVVLKLEHPDGK